MGFRKVLLASLAVAAMILGAAPAASAATIQIGTFNWDAIAEDEDEFLFFCDATAPCSRFTVTNDLDDLSSSELALLGLPSADLAFDDVRMPGVLDGSLGSLSAAIGSFVWIASGHIDVASISFQFFNGLTGTLVLPSLTGPTGNPAAIYVETEPPSTPVPEPTTLLLVGTGLVSAYVRRRQLQARA
jgi:hypothetical protein